MIINEKGIGILEKAIKHYGKDNQKIKTVEELSELTKEIMKDVIGEGNKGHLYEELADSIIMIYQLYLMSDKDVVNNFIEQKINRLERRISPKVKEKDSKKADTLLIYIAQCITPKTTQIKISLNIYDVLTTRIGKKFSIFGYPIEVDNKTRNQIVIKNNNFEEVKEIEI